MTNSDNFNWYWLHELGSLLLSSDDEAYLRTAINRFYFSAFCEARDYLIKNKIFYNDKFEKMLRSGSGKVHSATKNIFRNAIEVNNETIGLDIGNALEALRKNRNKVDYESPSKNFKRTALESQDDSLFVFNALNKLK